MFLCTVRMDCVWHHLGLRESVTAWLGKGTASVRPEAKTGVWIWTALHGEREEQGRGGPAPSQG